MIAAMTWLLVFLSCPAGLTRQTADKDRSPAVSADTLKRLKSIRKKREELQAKINSTRAKENKARRKLALINRQFHHANTQVRRNKHDIRKTQWKIGETERTIKKTEYQEQELSRQAAKRLREIYEGQRLSFLESLFRVESLQALIDLFYYQERVAEMDRQLLAQLRANQERLAATKDILGIKKNKLHALAKVFEQKASAIKKKKLSQEEIAKKLRTQRAFYEKAEEQLAMQSRALESEIPGLISASERGGGKIEKGSGNMSLPIKARISSPFGYRRHPIFRVKKFHTGVDLAGPNRAPVKASDSGNVIKAGWYGGYGKVVIINHGNGKSTLYAHMSKLKVKKGQNVKKGQIVGYEGTTGFSTGPHVHFEVRVDGKPKNPLNYVKR